MLDGNLFLVVTVLFSGVHCQVTDGTPPTTTDGPHYWTTLGPSNQDWPWTTLGPTPGVGPSNQDCVEEQRCARLILKTTKGETREFQGTINNIGNLRVKSVTMEGPGCFNLCRGRNFRSCDEKVGSGSYEVKGQGVLYVRSIEYFADCSYKGFVNKWLQQIKTEFNNSNNSDNSANINNSDNSNNRYFLGGALSLSALAMITVLLPQFKKV